MKHKATQFELAWQKPEDFALIVETTVDGDAIERDRQRRARERAEATTRQAQWDLRKETL